LLEKIHVEGKKLQINPFRKFNNLFLHFRRRNPL
jgi:hypothetical protein